MVWSFWVFYHLQPRKNNSIYDTRCLPASKTTLFPILGASQPRKHRSSPARRRLCARRCCYGVCSAPPARSKSLLQACSLPPVRSKTLLRASCYHLCIFNGCFEPARRHLCARNCIRNRLMFRCTRYSTSLHRDPHSILRFLVEASEG